MFRLSDPEKALQKRLAEIDAETKQINTDAATRLNTLAAERATLHSKVFQIREATPRTARAEMAERLAAD